MNRKIAVKKKNVSQPWCGPVSSGFSLLGTIDKVISFGAGRSKGSATEARSPPPPPQKKKDSRRPGKSTETRPATDAAKRRPDCCVENGNQKTKRNTQRDALECAWRPWRQVTWRWIVGWSYYVHALHIRHAFVPRIMLAPATWPTYKVPTKIKLTRLAIAGQRPYRSRTWSCDDVLWWGPSKWNCHAGVAITRTTSMISTTTSTSTTPTWRSRRQCSAAAGKWNERGPYSLYLPFFGPSQKKRLLEFKPFATHFHLIGLCAASSPSDLDNEIDCRSLFVPPRIIPEPFWQKGIYSHLNR